MLLKFSFLSIKRRQWKDICQVMLINWFTIPISIPFRGHRGLLESIPAVSTTRYQKIDIFIVSIKLLHISVDPNCFVLDIDKVGHSIPNFDMLWKHHLSTVTCNEAPQSFHANHGRQAFGNTNSRLWRRESVWWTFCSYVANYAFSRNTGPTSYMAYILCVTAKGDVSVRVLHFSWLSISSVNLSW